MENLSISNVVEIEDKTFEKQVKQKFTNFQNKFNKVGFLLNYQCFIDSTINYAYYKETSLYEVCAKILEDFKDDFDSHLISIYDLSIPKFKDALLSEVADHLNQIRDDCFAFMYSKA